MSLQPTFKRHSLGIPIHITCWAFLFAFPLFFAQRDNGFIDWEVFIHHCVMPAGFFVIFYFNYFILIPLLLFRSRLRNFIFFNVLAVLFIALGQRWWNSTFLPPPVFDRHFAPPQYIFILRDMAALVFSAGLSVAVRLSIRWADAEAARREAVKSRTEAELKNLRNQLNPHFLLNTLNNIYALIAFDAEKAQQAVQELSKLLRYMLYDNQQMFVPLAREIDFIKNYIELMRIRVAANVSIKTEFQIDSNSQTLVAPLVFISLIENAFKHGISSTEPSYIIICISESESEISCTIKNSNHPKTATDKSGSGIGLEQVKQRLELIYAGRYKWNRYVSPDGKEYFSSLSIFLS